MSEDPRDAEDPKLYAARQRLKAARLEDHVKNAVASYPPLTPEQLDRISAALHPRTVLWPNEKPAEITKDEWDV